MSANSSKSDLSNKPKVTKHRDIDDEHGQGATFALVDMSTLTLCCDDLYDKEKVDIETLHLDDVYRLLQSSSAGLTDQEAVRRTEIFGPNKLEENHRSAFMHFISFFINPLSFVMFGAAIVAIALSNGFGKPPDWQDFLGVILLMVINACIGFYEERSSGAAVAALMESLAAKAKVRRDGVWREIEASELVPGDVVSFKLGDVIPADLRLFDSVNVSIDQAALTGESLPSSKKVGDQCFSGSTCKQGEGEGIVIAGGKNSFFGRAASLIGQDEGEQGHLQQVLAKIGLFCMSVIGIFIVAQLCVLYPAYKYDYRRGIDSILVLLIGGVPIAMPTVLSVTLAVGAQQLAKFKAIVTRIAAIEELAGVDVLCSDKTGTLTTNQLTVDQEITKTYSSHFQPADVLQFACYASRLENADAIDRCIVGALPDPSRAHAGIKVLDFVPFNPVDKRTVVTYLDEASGVVRRVSKGMTGVIIDLCSRNKTSAQENALEKDVEDFANRGLRALAICHEDVPSGDPKGEGTGFELVGLLAIFDPPRHDTKATIEAAQELGLRVIMCSGDQLLICIETAKRLGLGGANPIMFSSKVLVSGGIPDGYSSLDDMVEKVDGFAGVFPEHKYEIVRRLQDLGHLVAMTGDGLNDAPALSRANVGIAVEGATDAARGASDMVLTEPGLSTIIEAIRGARIIFQRMRNYAIYACAVTIRIVVGFTIMAFAYKFDFPPFMILIIALLNDGTVMTISLDRVKPSLTPDHWDLVEIFSYAIAYGLYLAASTIALLNVIWETSFFEDTFGVTAYHDDINAHELHMIIYLQVAMISQALIFCTRSQGWSWMERPSIWLLAAFGIAQLIASIIAAYADWGFTLVSPISGGWIGIIWVWNIIWYLPLDLIKFSVRATVVYFRGNELRKRQRKLAAEKGTDMHRVQSRSESLYNARADFIKAPKRFGFGKKKVAVSQAELERFSSRQAQQAGQRLSMHASRQNAA